MLAAAILSGGESRRMGSPKGLLPYRGKTFIEHLVEITRHPRVGVTRIVLGAGAEGIRAPARPECRRCDRESELDDRASFRRFKPQSAACLRDTEGLILCPVDHPLVSATLVAELIERFDASGKRSCFPSITARPPRPSLDFPRLLYDELLAASAEIGARQVVWAHPNELLEVPTDEEGVILNLNDPDTLRKSAWAGPTLKLDLHAGSRREKQTGAVGLRPADHGSFRSRAASPSPQSWAAWKVAGGSPPSDSEICSGVICRISSPSACHLSSVSTELEAIAATQPCVLNRTALTQPSCPTERQAAERPHRRD